MTKPSGPLPKKLGRYEIVGELGKGAMGVVYLGRDPLIGRELALKTFRLGYSAGDSELEQFRIRFLREAQSAGILSHPNIVTIHDVAVDPGGDFFIAMEYVRGTDLKLLMQAERLYPSFALEIVAQIAEGLGYAHSKGVVHRDIKPANIIITADEQAKITDFGIARVETSNLTMEGQLLGTPNYMSPEQIQGLEVDHRADLFSLGVMLYEMLTGQKPFFGENLSAVTHRIVYGDFTPIAQIVPDLPAAIAPILDRALAKNPAERYAGGGDMAKDIRAILSPPAPAASTATSRTSSFLVDSAAPAQSPEAVQPGDPQVQQPGEQRQAGVPPTAPAPSSTASPVSTSPVSTPSAATAPVHVAPVPAEVAAPSAGGGGAAPAVAAAPSQDTDAAAGGFLGRPSASRLGIVTAISVALALVALGVGRLVLKKEEVVPQGASPELERQIQYLPLVKEGRQFLEAGDPVAALAAFERAASIAPDNREVRRLRDQARQASLEVEGIEVDESYVTDRLDAARRALRRREYVDALRLAEEILRVEPDHRSAKDLARDARAGASRLEATRGRQQAQASPPAEPVTSAPSPTQAAPAPAAEGTLRIEFFSKVSEGRLTIFNGQERFYQQPFKFVTGESGFLKRARKTSGSITESITLASGALDLRIYVRPTDAQTRSAEIKGDLPPGGSRLLRIDVSDRGTVDVRLE